MPPQIYNKCPLSPEQGCMRDVWLGATFCELADDCAAPMVSLEIDAAPVEQTRPNVPSPLDDLGPMMPGFNQTGDV